MMAFDSQGIALILIVAVLSLVVGGAALWIEIQQFRRPNWRTSRTNMDKAGCSIIP